MFINKPIWELMEIPKSELATIDCICPKCNYHTAWHRSPEFLVCGWCFSSIPQPQREAVIQEIKEILSLFDFADKVDRFVKGCRDRDRQSYASWEQLPTTALQKMLTRLKDLVLKETYGNQTAYSL